MQQAIKDLVNINSYYLLVLLIISTAVKLIRAVFTLQIRMQWHFSQNFS